MKSITLQSQMALAVSLTLVKEDDNKLQFFVLPILPLTWVVMLLWQSRVVVSRVHFSVIMMTRDLAEQIDLGYKILSIGFNSVLWGLT